MPSDAPSDLRSIRPLLAPRRIAVVGASRDPQKVGGAIFRNILKADFDGTVFPVNPNAESVGGVKAWSTVRDLPEPVDLAVICAPARFVEQIVDDCVAADVAGLVIVTAGYGETGEEGRERERALRDRVRAAGLRMIGPNCLGVINTSPDVRMNATFAAAAPPRGRVAMASQSGALGIALLDQARSIGLGVSQFVSLGNRVDVSSNDLLELWADDEQTDIVLLYLESFGNAAKFKPIARKITRTKPVIAVKGGRSAAGARAASSHTGSLAGASAAAEALFRQAGVIQVESIEEMLGVAQILADQPIPRGDRVAIVTNAGGPGILAADACEAHGLEVADLSDETEERLRSFLPAEASVRNPIDMIASAPPETFGRALEVILADDGVDSVLLIYIEPLVTQPEPVAKAVRNAVTNHGEDKTVVACFMMSRGAPDTLQIGEGRSIPSFIFPEDAVRALARSRQYAVYRERPEGSRPQFDDVEPVAARSRVERALTEAGDERWLMPETAMAVLADYGIATVATRAASSVDEAVDVAASIGYPVALKVRSQTIVHKTDIDGVHLGLDDERSVRAAWDAIMAGATAAGRGAEVDGVIVQPMADVEDAQEVIVGTTWDDAFGPLLMVGLGGILVELLKDVSFALHPLTDADPRRMLERLDGLPLLKGWRGRPPVDLDALEELLLRFSVLVGDLPELAQMEMNPVLVRPDGGGCLAVDARALVRPVPEPVRIRRTP